MTSEGDGYLGRSVTNLVTFPDSIRKVIFFFHFRWTDPGSFRFYFQEGPRKGRAKQGMDRHRVMMNVVRDRSLIYLTLEIIIKVERGRWPGRQGVLWPGALLAFVR